MNFRNLGLFLFDVLFKADNFSELNHKIIRNWIAIILFSIMMYFGVGNYMNKKNDGQNNLKEVFQFFHDDQDSMINMVALHSDNQEVVGRYLYYSACFYGYVRDLFMYDSFLPEMVGGKDISYINFDYSEDDIINKVIYLNECRERFNSGYISKEEYIKILNDSNIVGYINSISEVIEKNDLKMVSNYKKIRQMKKAPFSAKV